MKKFISTMMVACMALSMVVSASGEQTNNYTDTKASPAFIETITGMYTDTNNEYTVLDTNGGDITANFYEENSNLFVSRNFDQIYENAVGTISIINRHQEITTATYASGDVNRTANEMNYELCYSTDGKWTKEIVYTVSGTYIYNTISQRIISATYPTLQMEPYTWGDAFFPRIESRDSRKLVATDGSSVVFSYFFRMRSGFDPYVDSYAKSTDLDFGTHGYSFSVNA